MFFKLKNKQKLISYSLKDRNQNIDARMDSDTSEDKNPGFRMNCPCNFFTIEVILSTVQTFDKGSDAKCSECESYLCTQVVHLYMKLPCVSVSMQMPPPSCKW